jgi:hypothetical protein
VARGPCGFKKSGNKVLKKKVTNASKRRKKISTITREIYLQKIKNIHCISAVPGRIPGAGF